MAEFPVATVDLLMFQPELADKNEMLASTMWNKAENIWS